MPHINIATNLYQDQKFLGFWTDSIRNVTNIEKLNLTTKNEARNKKKIHNNPTKII